MKNIDLFWVILKQTHMKKYLLSFLAVFFVLCFLIMLCDPDIHSYWDALWFGFMIVTTVGFGDLTVTTWSARILTAVLGLYGVLSIGFICGVGASWLFEVVKKGKDESVAEILWQLEHLDALDEKQIQALSSKATAAGTKTKEEKI